MATLYVSEYPALQKNCLPVAVAPILAKQTVVIGAGSLASAAFSAGTGLIRVHPDAICSIVIGPNLTADATHARMAAGTTEYFAVQPGHQISVITNS